MHCGTANYTLYTVPAYDLRLVFRFKFAERPSYTFLPVLHCEPSVAWPQAQLAAIFQTGLSDSLGCIFSFWVVCKNITLGPCDARAVNLTPLQMETRWEPFTAQTFGGTSRPTYFHAESSSLQVSLPRSDRTMGDSVMFSFFSPTTKTGYFKSPVLLWKNKSTGRVRMQQ